MRLLISLFLLLPCCAFAAAPATAPAADTGLAALQAQAAQGDAGAETVLGLDYLMGKGVPRSSKDAAALLHKAADRGYPDAEGYLCYLDLYPPEPTVPPDYKQAVDWCQKAAAQGNANAEYLLGNIFRNGLGVKQDYTEAVLWLTKAAAQSDVNAEIALGTMYGLGQGVPQDLQASRNWVSRASEQGSDTATFQLASFYIDGFGVDKDLKRGLLLTQQAADHGFPPAQAGMGQLYDMGRGVKTDKAKANQWLRKSADGGYAPSQVMLAARHLAGLYPDLSDAQAMQWLDDCRASDLECLNDSAWFFATTPRQDLRDPAKAARLLAAVVAQDPDDPAVMDTLAAVYAAQGKYQDAVAEEQKAMGPSNFPRDDLDQTRFVKHLASYKAGKPYIDVGAAEF